MQRKFILKFDIKNDALRCHMYQVESIRLQGECSIDVGSVKLSKGYARVVVDSLYLQLDKEFNIEFKVNSIGNIRNWVKQNIFKIYIRENVPALLEEAIFKSVADGTIVIKD